jgi:hypothetical protein
LKNSILFLLSEIVTFTDSSRNANSEGEGRKSGTILTSPIGSSVYFIFELIYNLAFPPVTGSKYAYHVVPIGKAYRENSITDLAETIITHFIFAVVHVFGNDTMGICKGILGHCK